MTTITREQLRERAREKVKSLEFAVTQTAFSENRAELEEELELARIALASLEAAEKRIAELEANKCKPVMFIDGDISPADADKLAAVIREFNEETETPAARMARIIRENPHPTNMCDMPAAGIGVKGVGEVTDKSPLERLQAANNENRQMVMVSVGTLKAARREILSHVAANGKGVMTDIVLNQINAVIGKG